MFYVVFAILGMFVFYCWKRLDLDLLSLKSEAKVLSRSLGGSPQAPKWLQAFILDFEMGGASYLPFLTHLGELGEDFRRQNRKLLSCYVAKSCHMLVIVVVMTTLNFNSSINFCLVILIFTALTVYCLESRNREHLLGLIGDLKKDLDPDFAHLNELSDLRFKRRYTLLSTAGTLAELALFLLGMMEASHFFKG